MSAAGPPQGAHAPTGGSAEAPAASVGAPGHWNMVRLEDVKPVPWRNGGGVTRELLVWPDPDDWRVRMSVAEVAQDGPFSRFDGVQRWFTVLAGAGVRLRLEGVIRELTDHHPPFEFDGGAATQCELIGGPTRDFNLMLRDATGRTGRVRGTQLLECGVTDLIAIYTVDRGGLAVFGDEKIEIGPQTLAWRILPAKGSLSVDSHDALWMEIKR